MPPSSVGSFNRIRLVLLLVALCSGAGCDGFISIEGRAYEWVSPPASARSSVYVDERLPDTVQLRPLEGVTVVVFHGADYAEEPIDPGTPWKTVDTTMSSGLFRTSSTTAPGSFHAAIRATKEGFEPAEAVFLHDAQSSDHVAAIVLVLASADTAPN